MDKGLKPPYEGNFFEKNLACLSHNNPGLARLLADQTKTGKWYKFNKSRTGESVPAWIGGNQSEKPLHSMMDPVREAKRLMDTAVNNGFVILLGLGGPYHCEAALERESVYRILVIEYNAESLAELFFHLDYTRILSDNRVELLADPTPREIENCFIERYKPALHGGFITLPLRTRIAYNNTEFTGAAQAVESAVKKITADYSVQAHFGLRWFSNILRNISRAETETLPLPEVQRAAVCAAGPSLDIQIPLIREKRAALPQKDFFLIATDTSYPALIANGIKPDAVISMDCQHISYYHFMETLPDDMLLFLDLASPPLIASRSKTPYFFYGGHPLCAYMSRVWKQLPVLDTSGGNVTYTAVSLANYLGAKTIELYGADFSYPLGLTYAKGTYIHGIFQRTQTRLNSLESLYSTFLYRTPVEKKVPSANPKAWYYETDSLRFYREYIEKKNPALNAELLPVLGMGAPIYIEKQNAKGSIDNSAKVLHGGLSSASTDINAVEFLADYREKVNSLPIPKTGDSFPESLSEDEYAVLNTMLPTAAAIRRRKKEQDFCLQEILREMRKYCLGKIDLVLGQGYTGLF